MKGHHDDRDANVDSFVGPELTRVSLSIGRRTRLHENPKSSDDNNNGWLASSLNGQVADSTKILNLSRGYYFSKLIETK